MLYGQDGLIAAQPVADLIGSALSVPFIIYLFRLMNRLEKDLSNQVKVDKDILPN